MIDLTVSMLILVKNTEMKTLRRKERSRNGRMISLRSVSNMLSITESDISETLNKVFINMI